MKAECCKPPSVNAQAQQQRFDRWRKEFNEERPHEALGMRTPAEVYQPSARRMDERIKVRLYDLGTETKRVSEAGYVTWRGSPCYVGESFGGVKVAFEPADQDGLVLVRYANVKLGTLDGAPNARLQPTAYTERWERKPCQPKDQGIQQQ